METTSIRAGDITHDWYLLDAKDQILSFYKKNAQALASLKAPIFEEKVVEHIINTVKINEKKITREQLLKK